MMTVCTATFDPIISEQMPLVSSESKDRLGLMSTIPLEHSIAGLDLQTSSSTEDVILSEIEAYLSDDSILRSLAENQEGYVSIATLLSLGRVRSITQNAELLIRSLLRSSILELSPDHLSVRRKGDASSAISDCNHARVLIIDNLPAGCNKQMIEAIFGRFGDIASVTLNGPTTECNFSHAVVEYATIAHADAAFAAMANPTDWRAALRVNRAPSYRKHLQQMQQQQQQHQLQMQMQQQTQQQQHQQSQALSSLHLNISSFQSMQSPAAISSPFNHPNLLSPQPPLQQHQQQLQQQSLGAPPGLHLTPPGTFGPKGLQGQTAHGSLASQGISSPFPQNFGLQSPLKANFSPMKRIQNLNGMQSHSMTNNGNSPMVLSLTTNAPMSPMLPGSSLAFHANVSSPLPSPSVSLVLGAGGAQQSGLSLASTPTGQAPHSFLQVTSGIVASVFNTYGFIHPTGFPLAQLFFHSSEVDRKMWPLKTGDEVTFTVAVNESTGKENARNIKRNGSVLTQLATNPKLLQSPMLLTPTSTLASPMDFVAPMGQNQNGSGASGTPSISVSMADVDGNGPRASKRLLAPSHLSLNTLPASPRDASAPRSSLLHSGALSANIRKDQLRDGLKSPGFDGPRADQPFIRFPRGPDGTVGFTTRQSRSVRI